MSNELLCILLIVGGFVSGSVMYSAILPRLFCHIDIRSVSDDGNAGAYNVFKHCGVPLGIVCLLCDMLKGFVPVLLGVLFCDIHSLLFSLVIIAPTLGHALGIFSKWQGGKCISIIFGEMIALVWISPELFVLAVLFVTFCIIPGIHSDRVRSIITFSCFLVIAFIIEAYMGRVFVGIGCSTCALISVICHIRAKEGAVVEAEAETQTVELNK
jgi:glycerol-3-phosphate acyltransferase PlsY